MTCLRRCGACAWVIVAATLAMPTSAWAQAPGVEVEALIRRGLSLRRDGRDAEAYQSFEAAWNLSPNPRARAQMGLAAQAMGRWADADRLLREALAVVDDHWVVERRPVLDRSLAEIDAHLGMLEVQSNVAGATVRVDGAALGTTPLRDPLRLPAGSVTLQIGAPGYLEVTRQAVLTVGQTTREQIDLVAVPRVDRVVGPLVAATGDPTPPTRVAGPARVIVPPPAQGSGRGGVQRTLAWTTGGVALAGIALGAVFLGLRNAEANAFNARNADADPANDCQRGSTAQACVDAESTVSTRGTLATTGFVLGGAAALASAVLFATLPARSAQATVGLRGCAVSPGREGLAMSCVASF